MIYNTLSTVIKFVLVAVFVGAVLNEFDISADEVLTDVGFTPQHIMTIFREGIDWALPHFILGALVLIPIWVVIFLLKPPRLGK
ncbi:MAG: DUF6460 domain-containing protein [Parvibaculum sp.]|jgi:hypothetical protein|uniref:DUF6460 domain-containing protein n=1 Tax=Parvibaculum sp. TaxID=2024848 RepID=UPI0025ED4A64|nr:DUF6460 domain-containing protein [Parvibaculum sp.]MCE9649808.1 DUF6460 domain-containing protein [Parvibaculum sp.]